MRPLSFPVLSVFLVLSAGCKDPEADTIDSQLWTGWNYTWERLSHRVSLIEAVMESDGTASMGLVGGDWSTGSSAASDSGLYRMRFQEISSPNLAVVHGETEMILGPGDDLVERVEQDVSELVDFDHHIALLRGFSINTDAEQSADYPLYDEETETGYEPALGYCSQGFGFSLGAVELNDSMAAFDATASVRWGPTGPDDPIDRSDMNEAIPFAQTAVRVAWTLVGYNGSETHVGLEGSVDYDTGTYSDQPALTGDSLGLSLDSGAEDGILGLVSFNLGLEVQTDPDQGEYLRSFGVEVMDEATGSSPFDVSAVATNSSLIETAAIRFQPSLELAWIELEGAPDVSHILWEGQHDVGLVPVDEEGPIQ